MPFDLSLPLFAASGLALAAVIGMHVLQRGKMEGIMRYDGSMSSTAWLEGR